MKRFLILVTVAVVAIWPVAGCLGEIKTYTDSGQAITIGVKQEFIIALGSIPTTSCGWQGNYDETIIELVEKTYQPGEEAKKVGVGAGGVELFRFKALKRGETRITMTYKSPWGEEIVNQKIFTVNIK